MTHTNMLFAAIKLNFRSIFVLTFLTCAILWKVDFLYMIEYIMATAKVSTMFKINTVSNQVVAEEPSGRQLLFVIAGGINNLTTKYVMLTAHHNNIDTAVPKRTLIPFLLNGINTIQMNLSTAVRDVNNSESCNDTIITRYNAKHMSEDLQ